MEVLKKILIVGIPELYVNIYNLTPKCIFYVKNLKLCNLSNEQTRDAKFLENAAILQNSLIYIFFKYFIT